LRVLLWCFALLFGVVEARLVHLQFGTADFWRDEARKSRTDIKTIPFQRGAIRDRLGRPLAVGLPVHDLAFDCREFRRETPAGAIIGASRILARLPGFGGSSSLREIVSAPQAWVVCVLSRSPADVRLLPKVLRDDYGFYARALLGETRAEFKQRIEGPEQEGQPFARTDHEVGRVTDRLRVQIGSLEDLAQSLDVSLDEFVALVDAQIDDVESDLARVLGGRVDDADKRARDARRDHENRTRTLFKGIGFAVVHLVDLASSRLSGFEVAESESRVYPDQYTDLSPLLMGFVRSPSSQVLDRTDDHQRLERELRSLAPEQRDVATASLLEQLRLELREVDYRPDDDQGRMGLEALLEPVLRGRRGWRVVEQDSANHDMRLLETSPPVDGRDVTLTLDAALQQAAERVLDEREHPGAIVLLDPADGAILTLATWPDPTREQLEKHYGELLEDPRQPLYQRAFRPPGNPPPPGSVFKAVAAAAILESGKLDVNETFLCEGAITIGATTLRCTGFHGDTDLVKGLQKSCNIYFYRAGDVVGIDAVVRMAERFGLGEATGFGSPLHLGLAETSMSLGEFGCPIDLRGCGSRSFTMRSSIGQGAFDDVTPLQVAAMIAPFANGGKRVRPYLVSHFGAEPVRNTLPESLGLERRTLQTIRRAMALVCEPGGTADPDPTYQRDLRPWRVAGKTGTAEVADAETHAWFAGFCPHDAPQLVFAVYLENAGLHGGEGAAPVLNRLLEQPELEQFLNVGAP